MKELTKAEEQVMQILWNIGEGFVKDVIEHYDEPKPAYNTVSTIIRILETKGFVNHKAFGKTHQYFPLILKEQYSKELMGSVVKNYFSNSLHQLVSFFAKEEKMSVAELEEIRLLMEEEIEKQKK
jgi:BlaI family transcriptional regulator, penicillinase repressor